MSKVTYTSLKLKPKEEVKTFDFNGVTIEVKQYLPIDEKYDLISIALQKAKEDNIYNELKLDMYFDLYLVYLYTNVTFTDKQKEDEAKLYDALQSNGFFTKMIEVFNEEEYDDLVKYIELQKRLEMTYNTTAAGVIYNLFKELPAQAENLKEIIDNFDPQKYQAVVDFAKAANGGREIE